MTFLRRPARRPTTASFACAAACALAAPAALSQPVTRLQPGLWEHQVTMKTASGQIEAMASQMRQQIERMPPEQRQRIEQMMRGRGVAASGGAAAAASLASGQPTTVQTCITAEQAARDELPLHDRRCTAVDQQRSGNTLRVRFACGSGEHAANGTAEFTLLSDRQLRGTATVDAHVAGRPETLQIEQTGRWLNAECGSVKPR